MDLSMFCKSGSFPFQSPHSCMDELYKWAFVASGSTVEGWWCGMSKPLGLGKVEWQGGLCICDWVRELEIVVTLFCVIQVGLMWPQKSLWKAGHQGGHNWYHNGKRRLDWWNHEPRKVLCLWTYEVARMCSLLNFQKEQARQTPTPCPLRLTLDFLSPEM